MAKSWLDLRLVYRCFLSTSTIHIQRGVYGALEAVLS